MKNLGAEANHDRECQGRHLEIWRENEFRHVIRVSSKLATSPCSSIRLVDDGRSCAKQL